MMSSSVEMMEVDNPKEKPVADKAKHGIVEEKMPESFDCNICGRSFPFLSSLSQHMRRHTGVRPYKCPYCDHRASQKGNLKVHIRSHKLGTLSTYHSNEDDEGGADEVEMKVSEGLDGGTSPTKSSSACNRMIGGDGGEETRRKVAVRSMKREKSNGDQRPFCCRLCGYEAQREDQLLSHIEKVHITADAEDEPNMKDESVAEPDSIQPQNDGTFPCETCGQIFSQAWFLKSHMKKHAGILDHSCRICGRRFREAWFLKSHMKTHNTRSRSRTKSEYAELPVTINDVAQDPEMSTNTNTSVYQTCCKCGNLFHSKESLRAHDKVHSFNNGKKSKNQVQASDDEDTPAAKRRLLDYLNLQPIEEKAQMGEEEEREKKLLGKRIPELDPLCSYQAWHLATKGKVVEPVEFSHKYSEKDAYREEDLSGAAVVFEKESSQYVIQSQEKRGSGRRSSSGLGSQASSGDRTPDSLSDSEYRPSSRQDRRRSQSQASNKSNECFECGKVFRSRHQMIVHQRVHRKEESRAPAADKEGIARSEHWGSTSDLESGSPSRPSTPGYGDSPPASTLRDQASEMGTANSGEPLADVKPFVCSQCDFVTTESQVYLTHVRVQHPAAADDRPSSDRGAPCGYPKLKMALLQGLKSSPPHSESPSPQTSALDPSMTAVNLCVRAEGYRGTAFATVQEKFTPKHKCSFCAHSTNYPEVLWMHQTIAHRINGSSSNLAPKWALKSISKGSKDRRRTGPPPVLEGKECPPLPLMKRVQRTRPPSSTVDPPKRTKQHPATSIASSSRPNSTSGPQPLRTPVRPGSSGRQTEVQSSRFKSKFDQQGGASERKTSAHPRPMAPHPGAPKISDRYLMPQEGLGFMLSSQRHLPEYSRAKGSPSSHASASKPGTGGHGAVAGPNFRAFHGGMLHNSLSSLLSEPHADVKQEPAGETLDMPPDILSFLKNYTPHELAALSQRWGAANALLDPTGMLRFMRQGQHFCPECGKSFSQPSHLRTHMRSHTVGFDFNGLHRGTDAHTTASEAPKQGRGLSAASSAPTEPLRKGT